MLLNLLFSRKINVVLTVTMTLFVMLVYRHLKLILNMQQIQERQLLLEGSFENSLDIVSNDYLSFQDKSKHIRRKTKHLKRHHSVNFDNMYQYYDVPSIDCKGIFNNEKTVVEAAMLEAGKPEWLGSKLKEADYMRLSENCETFKTSRGYIMSPLSSLEENFPLAYR